jgi:hypothetical protein
VLRYFAEPYRFIPPHRGLFWPHVAKRTIPIKLRRSMRVLKWDFEGLDRFRDSLRQGAGVVLASNHCRWADPMVLGMLGVAAGTYLYYLASYHLFKQSRFQGWMLNRIGGFSIWREGVDREAIRESARILADAERPLVLFPEGTWFRQNDRVAPLQDGLALIARQAVRQAERPVLIHPVGLKYWMLEDPRPVLRRRLAHHERRLGWRPQEHLDLVERLEKLGGALLGLKEVEHFGQAQPGTLDERIARLCESHVSGLEKFYLGREYDGWVMERVRRLRQRLVRRLHEGAGDQEARVRRALDDLLFCENVSAQSQDYLREHPTLERLTETLERIEETLADDIEVVVAPAAAVVSVGPAIDARTVTRDSADPLAPQLRAAIQAQVDHLLALGPRPAWKCPQVPVSRRPAPAPELPSEALVP